jgi:Flp pilus assembly protein TadD
MLNRVMPGLGLLCLVFSGFSQNVQQAEELSRQGKYEAAENLYQKLLQQNPGNTTLLVNSAYNFSWNRQFEKARERFQKVLAIQPTDEAALAGLGYTYAWDNEYSKATGYFTRLKQVNPQSREAQKGLAYVYYYSGKLKKAATAFTQLVQDYPGETEFFIALAQVQAKQGKNKSPKRLLEAVLEKEPQSETVMQQLNELKYAPAFAELDTWGGYATSAGTQAAGLRNIALAIKATPTTKAIVRFDNNLSLDNRFFAQKQIQANTVFAGAIHDWNNQFTSRAEIGYRTLPEQGTQRVFATEQVIFFRKGEEETSVYHIKLGGFAANGNKAGNEYLLYSAISIPLSNVLAVEPAYYYSTVVTGKLRQHRIQTGMKYLNHRLLEITGGGFFGREFSPATTQHGNIYGGYLFALVPIGKKTAAMCFLKNEWSPFNNLFSAGLGIKMKLYR